MLESASVYQLYQNPPSINIPPALPNFSLDHYNALISKAQALEQLKSSLIIQSQKALKALQLQKVNSENVSNIPSSISISSPLSNTNAKLSPFQTVIIKQDHPTLNKYGPETSPEAPQIHLKDEIRKMLQFLLKNMGQAPQAVIDNARKYYSRHPQLLQVYDKLVMKYFSAKKCKEDIIRYIIRKAFKVMKTALVRKEKLAGKKASLMFIKTYFHSRFEDMEREGVNLENEDELLEFIMPYKKNSLNKTMNSNFVVGVFSSEEFCKEYQVFLEKFDDYLKEDNDQKFEKSIKFILECIQYNNISKLGTFNRLPWLDSWLENTRNIAHSLPLQNRQGNDFKKIKL